MTAAPVIRLRQQLDASAVLESFAVQIRQALMQAPASVRLAAVARLADIAHIEAIDCMTVAQNSGDQNTEGDLEYITESLEDARTKASVARIHAERYESNAYERSA